MVSCCILIGYGRMGLLEGAVMNWPGFQGIQARGKFQHDNRAKKNRKIIIPKMAGHTCSKPLLCVPMLVFEGVNKI